MLTDGIDLYGKGYTDCVLAARASLMKDNPAGLKAIIKGMMQAQLDAETQTEAVLKELVGKYYKTSMENAKIAQGKQPAVVDARSQTEFILQRTDSVVEMGYIKKKPGRDAIDWTMLEAVIKENPDLYGKLKYKSAWPDGGRRARRPSGLRRRDIPPGGGNAPASPPWPAMDWLSKVWWTCLSVGLFAGIWELCWAMGWADPQAPAAAAHLPLELRRAGQVLQHRDALAGRQVDGRGPVGLRIGDDHRGRHHHARVRRAWCSPRCWRSASACGALLARLRQAGAADRHAAVAGVADRLAAGGDLPVRHRQRAGHLHGRGGAVLPHGAGDHHPDRRRAATT